MLTACCVLALGLVQGAPPDSAILHISNRAIVVFHAPLGALAPTERALAARARLLGALEAGAHPDSVTVRAVPEGRLLLLDGRPVFTVTPADADTAAGNSLDDQVALVAARLRLGLAEELEARSLAGLLTALGLALLATLALALIGRLLVRAHARMTIGVDATALRRLPHLRLRGFTLIERDQLRRAVRAALTAGFWLAGLVAGYVYVAYVLTRFPQTRQWGEALGEYLVGLLAGIVGESIRAVPGLLTVAILLLLARAVARLVTAFFRAVENETIRIPGIHADTAAPSRRIAVAVVWLFAVAVVYPFIPGSDTASFKGVSVFAGLLITLASTGVLGQAMSGLVVMYTRALRVGDYVEVGEVEGVVSQVGLLSTKVQTTKLVEVTVPSALLLSRSINNLSRLRGDQGIILHTTVTIGYDAAWRQVHELLGAAARNTEGLRPDPPPFVRQRALSDFYVEYELNAYTLMPERRIELLSALHQNIQDLFNQYGVQIMSPHYEGDKDRPVVVPPARWYPPPVPRPPEDGP